MAAQDDNITQRVLRRIQQEKALHDIAEEYNNSEAYRQAMAEQEAQQYYDNREYRSLMTQDEEPDNYSQPDSFEMPIQQQPVSTILPQPQTQRVSAPTNTRMKINPELFNTQQRVSNPLNGLPNFSYERTLPEVRYDSGGQITKRTNIFGEGGSENIIIEPEDKKLEYIPAWRNLSNDIAYEYILPEITIVPDNSSYLASKYLDEFTKNIKDENIKKRSKYLIYNQLEGNITSKGEEDINNKISTNQKIINLYKIYKDAGSPKIKNNTKLNASKNINQLTEKRASYTPITNTIHTNTYVSAAFDIIPELAHALQRKKYGLKHFIQLPSDLKIKGKTAYEREGTTEHEAHSIIEPAIANYILTNEFENGGSEEPTYEGGILPEIDIKAKPMSNFRRGWRRLMKTPMQVPFSYGTATAAATSGPMIYRQDNLVNSTVGNELAYTGALLTSPLTIGGTAKAWEFPVVRRAFDVLGSVDGVRNALSDNGISKTIRLAKEGDTTGAIKSGIGDAFDIVGAGDAIRFGKKLLTPAYRGYHAYNTIVPFSYERPFDRGKDFLKSMLLEKQYNTPAWMNTLDTNRIRSVFKFEGISDEAVDFAMNARDDAWRLYTGQGQLHGTYIKNADGTYSYDLDKLKQVFTNPEEFARVLDRTIQAKHDYIGNTHGGLWKADDVHTGHISDNLDVYDYGNLTIEDLWDLQPFSRKGDGLISGHLGKKLTEKFGTDKFRNAAQNFRRQMFDKGHWGLNGPQTTFGKMTAWLDRPLNEWRSGFKRRLVKDKSGDTYASFSFDDPVGFHTEPVPISRTADNIIDALTDNRVTRAIDKKVSQFEVSKLLGGEPFYMRTNIPYTRKASPKIEEFNTTLNKYPFIKTAIIGKQIPDGFLDPELVQDIYNKFDFSTNFKNIDINKLFQTESTVPVSKFRGYGGSLLQQANIFGEGSKKDTIPQGEVTYEGGMLPEVEIIKKPKRNFWDRFTQATIGAAMAENPAIMTASGWKYDNNGQLVQRPDENSERLADNLALISAFSPTHPINAALEGAGILTKAGLRNIALAKTLKNGFRPNSQIVRPQTRIKLGDIEINNPQLAYRQGQKNIIDDFIEKGKVVTPEGDYGSVQVGGFNFGKSFEEPMFKQNDLWYGVPEKNNSGLLVTAEPLDVATKRAHADRRFYDISGTGDTRITGLNNGRRIQQYPGQLNKNNTTAYLWENGYGYRKVSDPTATYFFSEKPSKLTVAERLGIPKGDRGNLSQNQIQALEDLDQFIKSGKYRQAFRVTPNWEDFGWNLDKSNPTFIQQFVKEGFNTNREHMHGPWATVTLQSPTGKGNLSWNTERNMAGYSSRSFPTPKGFTWAPGEANMMIDGANGQKIILTAPKTDFLNNVEEEAASLSEKLANTIDKDIMKDFWINARKAQRPGTYLSGDNGRLPLGSDLVQAYKNKQLHKTSIFERPIELQHNLRTGLSPDSFSSIIRQGNRDNSLRWGEGFHKWNDSAVQNKHIYDAFMQLNKNEITPAEYEKIFNEWSLKIGGRPLQWRIFGDKKIPIHPHPYIYAKKLGGPLLLAKKYEEGGDTEDNNNSYLDNVAESAYNTTDNDNPLSSVIKMKDKGYYNIYPNENKNAITLLDPEYIKKGYRYYYNIKSPILKQGDNYYIPAYESVIKDDFKNNLDDYLDFYGIDKSRFTEIPNSELRNMLPKRDFIGGTNSEVRAKTMAITNLDKTVNRIANLYGINKNIILNRLAHEGIIDRIADEYNYPEYADMQKDVLTPEYIDNLIDKYGAYAVLGLDYAADHLRNNKIELLDSDAHWFDGPNKWDKDYLNAILEKAGYNDYLKEDKDYYPSDIANMPDDIRDYLRKEVGGRRNEKLELVDNPIIEDLNSGLNIMAAEIKRLYDIAKDRGIEKDYIDTYVNAMYNLGENHKDLNSRQWIENQYTIPDWYKAVNDIRTKKKNIDISDFENGGKLQVKPTGPLFDMLFNSNKEKAPLIYQGHKGLSKWI